MFAAQSGWDPITGFGSINYAKFLSYYTTNIPTAAPTAAPTTGKVSKRITFYVSQPLVSSSVTASQFLASSSAIQAFEVVIQTLLSSRSPDDIGILTATDITIDLSAANALSSSRSLATSQGIALNYTLVYDIEQYDYLLSWTMTEYHSNVTNTLHQGVQSDRFTQLLHTSSSTILQSLSVVTNPIVSNASSNAVSSSSGGSSSSNHTAVIAAVVVVLLVVLLVGIVLYCYRHKLKWRSHEGRTLLNSSEPKISGLLQGKSAEELSSQSRQKNPLSDSKAATSTGLTSSGTDPRRWSKKRPSLLAQSMDGRDNPLSSIRSNVAHRRLEEMI